MITPIIDIMSVRRLRVAPDESQPEAVATAAFEFITGPLLENPHRVGKELRPPLADRHSARRGTYRVLYRIDDQAPNGDRPCHRPPRGHLPRLIVQSGLFTLPVSWGGGANRSGGGAEPLPDPRGVHHEQCEPASTGEVSGTRSSRDPPRLRSSSITARPLPPPPQGAPGHEWFLGVGLPLRGPCRSTHPAQLAAGPDRGLGPLDTARRMTPRPGQDTTVTPCVRRDHDGSCSATPCRRASARRPGTPDGSASSPRACAPRATRSPS